MEEPIRRLKLTVPLTLYISEIKRLIMKKIHYTYIITNLINNKKYIGDRSCECSSEEDSYLGSGIYLNNAKKKYGRENFNKEILEFFESKKEAYNAQEKYIIKFNTLKPNGYNISPKGGLGIPGSYHNEETKEKIRISHIGKKIPDDVKEKISVSRLGTKLSMETKRKISKSRIGSKLSKETKRKIGDSKLGKSSKLKGVLRSEETKLKISKTKRKNPFIYTDEIRKKISDAKKGKTPWNKGFVFTKI